MRGTLALMPRQMVIGILVLLLSPPFSNTVVAPNSQQAARQTPLESIPPPVVVDVAVCGLALNETVAVTGETVRIAVEVANYGDIEETFTVRALANSTRIGSKPVSLFGGAITIVLFDWNTNRLERGAYIIEAEAELGPNETDTTNNRYTAASPAKLTFIEADINGNLAVDILDAATLAIAFDTRGSAHWNSAADLNKDLSVDNTDLTLWRKNHPDLNRDGRIDCSDELLISLALGSSATQGWNPQADMDGDGDVDINDAAFLAINFDKKSV